MSKNLLAACALGLLAAPASAQSFGPLTHEGSTVTAAFNFHNDGDGDPFNENFTKQFNFASTYKVAPLVDLTFFVGYNQEIYEDEHYSDRKYLGLEANRSLTNGTIGGYLVFGHLVYEGDVTIETQFGLTGTYQQGAVGFEGYVGGYNDGETTSSVGLASTYDLGNGLSPYIFVRRQSDGGSAFDALAGFGLDFELKSAPVVLTAELSKHFDNETGLFDSAWNQVSVMATYKFGNGKKSVFRNIYNYDYYYD